MNKLLAVTALVDLCFAMFNKSIKHDIQAAIYYAIFAIAWLLIGFYNKNVMKKD